MQFTLQPRLHIYHDLIGRYDLLDKYKFSNTKFVQIDSIKILCPIRKLSSNNLSLILVKEFSAQRHFNINKTSKIGLRDFNITLRKTSCFIYLEFLLNSYFLNSKRKKIVHNSYLFIDVLLHSSFNNEFVSYFNESLNTNKSLLKYITKLKFNEYNYFIRSFLSYYFVP